MLQVVNSVLRSESCPADWGVCWCLSIRMVTIRKWEIMGGLP